MSAARRVDRPIRLEGSTPVNDGALGLHKVAIHRGLGDAVTRALSGLHRLGSV